jgi:flagellin
MIDFQPRGSSLAISNANRQKGQSIQNLSSGSRENIRLKDSGSFSMNVRLRGNLTVERRLSQNMQGLISYGQLQDGVLKNMGNLVARMTEIAALSTNSIQSDEDRATYQKEFLNLVNQFDSLQDNSFNGVKLLGNGYGAEKKEFLDSLKNSWLKASEDLIKDKYDWDPVTTDSWDLVVEENGPVGGSAAFVRTSVVTSAGANQYKADVQKMSFDLPDFTAPHTQPQSTADGVVAHEMVHLLQAQNSYFGDLIGGGSHKRDTWFKEGLAEFIRGADSRVSSHLQSGTSIADLVGEISVGQNWGGTSEEYAASFLAISYLHKKIVDAGMTDGIKHMTMWMRDQFQDPTKNAATSGINAYFGAHPAIGFIGNDNFLSDFTGVTGGQAFVSNLQTSGAFTNNDTGSIAGSDVSGNPADEKTAQSVVPDASGSPQGKYLEDETGEAPTFSYSGSGGTSTLTPIPQITFGDTSTYNLLTISSATQTLDYLGALSKTISGSRAIAGSNMSIVQNGLESLRTRTNSLGQSISRIQDTSFSEESTNMAKATIRLNFSLSMTTQANQTSASVVTSLLT